MLDRLKAFGRRTLAYNRQPSRLFLLPFSMAATILGFYLLITGYAGNTLWWVLIGLVVFVTVVDGGFWLVGYMRDGYRTSAPKTK